MYPDKEILDRANSWTQKPFDAKTRSAASAIIEKGGDELIDAFYKDLEFGTGGLRGVMGCGTNRINRYTIGLATQGLANYLKKQFSGKIKVAIAYDCRHNSREYSLMVAEVLAANEIHALLFKELRPTPALSFAVRHHNCQAGIVITASHNPPEYNGYKIYWEDGGQLVPPHDAGVIEEVRKVKIEDLVFKGDHGFIKKIGPKTDSAYLREICALSLNSIGKKDLSIVFTPIHGASVTTLPDALKNCGFRKVHIIKEQSVPDGDFPTVVSPNPEEAEALSMAVEKAEKIGADLVIGTDPDGDRVGIAVRNNSGEMELLNGNQTASVLIYYLLENLKQQDKLNDTQFIASTIVTTDLLDEIAAHYNIKSLKVLTGFKWIADIIRREEGKMKFIGGGEESYGYMISDFVRDKDANASGVMIAEAAAWAKANGSSFYKTLIDIYLKFGLYREELVSITKKGKRGAEEITSMMEKFREEAPVEIGGEKVVRMLDYLSLKEMNLISGEVKAIDLPKSNVIQFYTEKGSKITARPSGTEPKIKFYFSLRTQLDSAEEFDEKYAQLGSRIEKMKETLA